MATVASAALTPYDRIGGRPTLTRVVDRFYDLMESDRAYAALRQMHAEDLAPMRQSLADFLMAWMGGPRDWFEQRPGACMMSAHAKLGISRETADQWVAAMARALNESVDDPGFIAAMIEALQNMALAMARPRN